MINALPASLIAALIEESLDAVLIIDEYGRIRYVNHALEALCGHTGDELLGQPLDRLLPSSMAGHHDVYMQRLARGQEAPTIFGRVREFAIRHSCGETIPIALKALDLGAHGGKRYFGAFIEDLRSRRRMEEQHAALLARLEQQAMTDPLTEIANRRAFEAEATRMVAHARRRGMPMAVGIGDIDHFKKINDNHGHPAGDAVLRVIARRMSEAARATDFVARIGGEEFGLLLPEATDETAVGVAQRIREAIAAEPISTGEGDTLPVTISIGLATLAPGTPFEDALARADCALYQAKNNGRNRVECARDGAADRSRPGLGITRQP